MRKRGIIGGTAGGWMKSNSWLFLFAVPHPKPGDLRKYLQLQQQDSRVLSLAAFEGMAR